MIWTRIARLTARVIAVAFSLMPMGAAEANSLWADDCVFSFDPKTILETTETVCVTGDIDSVPPGQFLPLADVYIVANREWQLGDTFVDHYGNPTEIQSQLPGGSFLSEVVQVPPLEPGEYDLVLDEYPFGVYGSADLIIGSGPDSAFLVVADVIFYDTFETGTAYQWSRIQPFCSTPDVGLRVEVTWQTSGDPDENDDVGTDLDLHLLHPDAAGEWLSPYDCYRDNPAPDWGASGMHENAVVLLVDDDGLGPEIIQITDPQSVSYDVGIHYFDDLGFGPSIATITLSVDGTLAYEYPAKTLFDGEFWHVGSVEWPGGAFTVVDSVTPAIP